MPSRWIQLLSLHNVKLSDTFLTHNRRPDNFAAIAGCSSFSGKRPTGSLSELRPLPPCGIIRSPNRGRGEGLFSCPFSLSSGRPDRPPAVRGLSEHFQRITINTAPSGTTFGGNLPPRAEASLVFSIANPRLTCLTIAVSSCGYDDSDKSSILSNTRPEATRGAGKDRNSLLAACT